MKFEITVCMYKRKHIGTVVCMYRIYMYACMYERMYAWKNGRIYV